MFSSTFASSHKDKFQIRLTITSGHIGTYDSPKELRKILLDSWNHFLAGRGGTLSPSHVFYSLVADWNRGNTWESKIKLTLNLVTLREESETIKTVKFDRINEQALVAAAENTCSPWYEPVNSSARQFRRTIIPESLLLSSNSRRLRRTEVIFKKQATINRTNTGPGQSSSWSWL